LGYGSFIDGITIVMPFEPAALLEATNFGAADRTPFATLG
jgi:hypothetical protein